MDPSCFNAKAKDVMEGKSVMLAASSYRAPSNAGLDDNCLGRAQVNTVGTCTFHLVDVLHDIQN